MNVREWSGNPADSTLRRVMILMGSASAAIIIVALTAAFFPFFPIWIGWAFERVRQLYLLFRNALPKVATFRSVWRRSGEQDDSEEEVETMASSNEKDGRDDTSNGEARRSFSLAPWRWSSDVK
jgi:hypothetical protein